MNDGEFEDRYKNWHTMWSYAKSGIRMLGCLLAIAGGGLLTLAIFLFIAEIIGIIEEFV